MPRLTDAVRDACRRVAEQSRSVHIVEERLEPYARSLPLQNAVAPTLDVATHHVSTPQAATAFFLTLDAVNFGSGYFPHLRKRPGMSGYFTVASALKDEFDRRGPLSAERLAGITAEQCALLFGQDRHNPTVMGLMGLFATAWNDLGRLLLDRYGGDFGALVAAAGCSAERLAELLAVMPFYRDVERYEPRRAAFSDYDRMDDPDAAFDVPFYKRAQLTAADLELAMAHLSRRTGPGAVAAAAAGTAGPAAPARALFDDLERLTIFADNLVPHVLRIDGVLAYEPELAARIDAEELIPSGSPEEIEIRACALHAVELMKAALAVQGRQVTSMGLDYVLWTRGQQKHYKTIKPRHRCRSVFY